MDRPVTIYFPSGILSRANATGKLPHSSRYPVQYAQAELIRFPEGQLLRQFYEHFLFYLELYELSCNVKLHTGFSPTKPGLFLAFILEGYLQVTTSKQENVTSASGGTCYLAYNTQAKFQAHFPPGDHKLLYIALHPQWIRSMISDYPELEEIMHHFISGNTRYQVMPHRLITGPMFRQLKKLQKCTAENQADLGVALLTIVYKLLVGYHHLLQAKPSRPSALTTDQVRAITRYIHEKLRTGEPLPSVPSIAATFYITYKKMERMFLAVLQVTPRQYIIRARMEEIHRLLTETKLPLKDIAHRFHYSTPANFSTECRKYFGKSPRQIRGKTR